MQHGWSRRMQIIYPTYKLVGLYNRTFTAVHSHSNGQLQIYIKAR